MRTAAIMLWGLVATSSATAAPADDVRACLEAKAETAREGSHAQLVSAAVATLDEAHEAVFSFTLFGRITYRLVSCAAAGVNHLDAHIYDQTGKLLASSSGEGPPAMIFEPPTTGTYFLVLVAPDGTLSRPVGFARLFE